VKFTGILMIAAGVLSIMFTIRQPAGYTGA
jgi:hypothetical protein